MTTDQRTLLLLAAEALRNPSHWLAEHRLLLADATDRIAGAEKPDPLSFTTTLDPRFGPNTAGSRPTVGDFERWRKGKP